MNAGYSFQLPRQSFPTDVTVPAPSQLPSHESWTPTPPSEPPRKQPERIEEEPSEEEENFG
jgi:hypothetical protein